MSAPRPVLWMQRDVLISSVIVQFVVLNFKVFTL